jgi:hypothetical protein
METSDWNTNQLLSRLQNKYGPNYSSGYKHSGSRYSAPSVNPFHESLDMQRSRDRLKYRDPTTQRQLKQRSLKHKSIVSDD